MIEILLAAVAADEVGAVVADGQLGDQNQHLLTVTKDLFTEGEHIGKLLSGIFCLFLEGFCMTIEGFLDQLEGGSTIGRCAVKASKTADSFG